MIALRDDLNGLHDNTCIKVYDPALKKLIGVYPSYAAAGKRLGVSSSAVQQRCIRKTRVHSPMYGKEVACRLSKKTLEEDALMTTSKSKFL
jgi:hypothetical protein